MRIMITQARIRYDRNDHIHKHLFSISRVIIRIHFLITSSYFHYR